MIGLLRYAFWASCSLLLILTLAELQLAQNFDGAIAEITFNTNKTITLDIPPNSSYVSGDLNAYTTFQGVDDIGVINEATIRSDKHVTCFLSRFNPFFYDYREKEHWFGLIHFSTSEPLQEEVNYARQIYCYETSASQNQPGNDSFTMLVENKPAEGARRGKARTGEGTILRMNVPEGDKYSTLNLTSAYPSHWTGIRRTALFEATRGTVADQLISHPFHLCMGYFIYSEGGSYHMNFAFKLREIGLVDIGIDIRGVICCAINLTEEECKREQEAYRYRLEENAD